jgi:hypothetical protein
MVRRLIDIPDSKWKCWLSYNSPGDSFLQMIMLIPRLYYVNICIKRSDFRKTILSFLKNIK